MLSKSWTLNIQGLMIHLQYFLLSLAQPQAPVIEGVLSPISSTTEVPSKVSDDCAPLQMVAQLHRSLDHISININHKKSHLQRPNVVWTLRPLRPCGVYWTGLAGLNNHCECVTLPGCIMQCFQWLPQTQHYLVQEQRAAHFHTRM